VQARVVQLATAPHDHGQRPFLRRRRVQPVFEGLASAVRFQAILLRLAANKTERSRDRCHWAGDSVFSLLPSGKGTQPIPLVVRGPTSHPAVSVWHAP
jgi:hypothetical protein